MSTATIQLLRIFHIVFGAFWFGTTVFLVQFLLPSLRSVGPVSGAVMEQLTITRKLPMYMMFIPILTLITGIALFMHDSRVSNGMFMRSGPGRMFAIGGLLAMITTVLGMAVNAPTGRRLGALGQSIRMHGGPPTDAESAELGKLQDRMEGAQKIAAVLLLMTTVAMAIARYMPA